MAPCETIPDAARLWAIRVSDPAFGDWDGLTDWLEADPDHLAAYNAAIDDDRWSSDLFGAGQPVHAAPAATPAPERALRAERSGWLRGVWAGAIAASLLLLAGTGAWYATRPSAIEDVATAPGEQRTIDIADGSQIRLNGSTRVRFDRATPREIALIQGEALFIVRHDDARPFTVSIGDSRLIDLGTVFNVARADGRLDVAVAKGAVVYRTGQDDIRLNAGEGLSQAAPGAVTVLQRVDPAGIGSWQSGVLTYADADLGQVGRDLARNLGLQLDVDPAIAKLRFTGSLTITGKPAVILARIQPLLGVSIVHQGKRWRMVAVHGPIS